MFDGRVDLAELKQHLGQRVMGLGLVRLELEGVFELSAGRGKLSLPQQQLGELLPGAGAVGLVLEDLGVVLEQGGVGHLRGLVGARGLCVVGSHREDGGHGAGIRG
jgi:hypothetical protein